jgi:hypothetical protein
MLEPIPFAGYMEIEEMNANELANKLADEVDIHVAMGGRTFFKEVSSMLRQFGLAESIIKQQEIEIKNLKDRNKDLESFYRTVKALQQ